MPVRWLLSRVRSWRVLLVLLVLVLAALFGTPHARAWYDLTQARSALARYHPETAQPLLSRCLAVWPHSLQAHLLASRAARQTGDLEEADRHLRTCQDLVGGTSDEVALEWALLQAVAGNTREVEEFLQRRADQDPAAAPLIWEALAEGYIRLYRIIDAVACLEHWLRLDPDNLRALELRGLAYQAGKSSQRGTEDFRRVLEQDPHRNATRWGLVLCLLDVGGYDEALTHLQLIQKDRPDDPEVLVRLARCHNMLGRPEQARQILDTLLEEFPTNGLALRTRGQFALADRRPDLAERWLRRGISAWPNDYQTQWLLLQSLLQQNMADEARDQLRKTEAVKARAERIGELRSRKLSEQPLDPALHYEMGVLLLRTGHDTAAEGWLLSALNLDPRYQRAHSALADYYQRRGDPRRAAEHRRQAAANP